MVTLEAIIKLINSHKDQVLLYAQSSLSEHQFIAFRKLFLNEMGRKGLESELADLFNEKHK